MIKIRDKDKFLKGLKSGKYSIKNASALLKQDNGVLLNCAKYDRVNVVLNEIPKDKLYEISQSLELLIKFLDLDPRNFGALDDSLRYNKDFIVSMCEKKCSIFEHIPPKLKIDVPLLKDIVSVNGLCIKYIASTILAQEREINFLSVNNNAISYKFIHPNFFQDYEIAKLAVTKRAVNFFFLIPEFKENPEIIKSCFQGAPTYAYYIFKDKLSDRMKRDVGVSLYACRSNLKCLIEVPNSTFSNKSFEMGFTSYILSHVKELSSLDDGGLALDEFKQNLQCYLEQKREMVFKERMDLEGEKAEAEGAALEFINSLIKPEGQDENFSDKESNTVVFRNSEQESEGVMQIDNKNFRDATKSTEESEEGIEEE